MRVDRSVEQLIGDSVSTRQIQNDIDCAAHSDISTLCIPPLRTRPDDILPLLDHYLTRSALERRVVPPRITKEALTRLVAYAWPGNVSQLQRVATRLVHVSSGRNIQERDLPREILEALATSVHDVRSYQ